MIFTETPANCVGNGRVNAVQVEGASPDPKTVRIMPGAYDCRKDAPLVSAAMTGAPRVEPLTLIIMDAVAPVYDESPLYCAVMESEPTARLAPEIVIVAEAAVPAPDSVAEPSGAPWK